MLAKPSRLARLAARFDRRKQELAARQAEERAERSRWAGISHAVASRDQWLCRVCAIPTFAFGKGDPRTWGQAHHLVYRSAGGTDELSNLIWVCGVCHDDEHRHVISITGTAENLTIVRHP